MKQEILHKKQSFPLRTSSVKKSLVENFIFCAVKYLEKALKTKQN